MISERIDRMLEGTGLFVRGGFHVETGDGVPGLPDGRDVASVLLVGNAGRALWDALNTARPGLPGRHPQDDWMNPILQDAAERAGAHCLLANDPPYPPVQRWARKAEPVYQSPIGLMIHPEYGLWHVYRAAFLFAEPIELPPRTEAPNPCESCAKKPCLSVCPADAFKPEAFDAPACVDHVESASGANCRERGCLARRACPVGRPYAYPPEAGAFHMAAVARVVRRMQADGRLDGPIKTGPRGERADES